MERAKWWGALFALLCSCSAGLNEERVTTIPEGDPWSDAESWPSGHVPKEGEDIVIPAGKQILLDTSPPALGSLTLDGTLVFDDKDLELSAEWISVHGTLRIGHPKRAYKNRAVITLTAKDTEEEVMGMGTRGILVMKGGTLDLYGTPPAHTWSKLAEHLPAGGTSLNLLDEVDWKTGDEIVVAPTDYYRIGATERSQVTAVEGSKVDLGAAIAQSRWGVLQYVDDAGVTLTPTTSVTESVLDERAEVGNLTRNIVIQGADDAVWKDQGFGAHLMIMNGAEGHLDGVELHRVGQAGRNARYPIHWHLWSYLEDPNGKAARGQFIKNSAIWESKNRCIVVHATNGLGISGNVCYDILGHAIFLEDAVERSNTIENNLVLHVRKPPEDKRLLRHDAKPAGYWLTNPDNVIRSNVVADSEGMGFWLAFPPKPLGLSKSVALEPSFMKFGEFSNNVAHSNYLQGMMFDDSPINDEGDVSANSYTPRKTGTSETNDPEPYSITGMVFYKHEATWQDAAVSFWNRTHFASFLNFVTADFNGTAFSGSSVCEIRENLVIGTSLNGANAPTLATAESETKPGAGRMGAASYHSDCQISDNVFVNLPATPGRPSGAFGSSDYYHTGVDKGLINNPNNRLINSHPGYRSESPNELEDGEGRENYSLSGALWDPHGYWGPAGNYWVYDKPFLTAGTECSEPLEPHRNDRTCKGPYYGVQDIFLTGEDASNEPARNRTKLVTRTDNDTVWFVDDGDCTPFLGGFRHFAAVKDGSYQVTFPAGVMPGDAEDGRPGSTVSCETLSPATPPSSRVSFQVTNVIEEDDAFILGVPFVATATPSVFAAGRGLDEIRSSPSWAAYFNGNDKWRDEFLGDQWHPITPAANLAAVKASTGDKYWHDTSNQVLWLKITRLGIAAPDASLAWDIRAYQPITFEINSQ